MKRLSVKSIYKIPEDRYEFYVNRSVDAMVDLLSYGEDAFIVKMDPTGRESLRLGFRIKRDLRKLVKEGVSEDTIQQIILEGLPYIPPGKFSGRLN